MATSSSSRKPETKDKELIDVVFTWSVNDVLNRDLYGDKVRKIPETFSSTDEYTKSFVNPLLEETHAELLSKMKTISRASTCAIRQLKPREDKFSKDYCYNISLERKSTSKNNNEKYAPQVGDLIALTSVKPRCINDFNPFVVALVQRVKEDDSDTIQAISSKPILFSVKESNKGEKSMFAVHLMNLTTNTRIWQALHSKLDGKNKKIVNKVLQVDSKGSNRCSLCSIEDTKKSASLDLQEAMSTFNLNTSQKTAVWNCIAASKCHHQETVNLIWGPPGTGKTKTVGCLLFALWKMKCRTLTCAPTNNAVLEVAARLMSLVSCSIEYDTYGYGDIVLFGRGERMKIGGFQGLNQVFLANRVSVLADCLSPTFGWRIKAESMRRLLQSPKHEYDLYLHGGRMVDDENSDQEFEIRDVTFGKNMYGKERVLKEKVLKNTRLSYMEFITKQFTVLEEKLSNVLRKLYTHMPTSYITLQLAKKMMRVTSLIRSVGTLIFHEVEISEEKMTILTEIHLMKELIQVLEEVLCETISFPKFTSNQEIENFCLENTCLIFCTASSSNRLLTLETNVDLLVVDEAGQLRECESIIPLQLSGLCDVILIGDEKQLPAMVQSKICENAEFGRSLFERLVSLKHTTHLLNIQYRMHPMISSFPNREFYGSRILNGPNVKERSYKKQFLEGDMFGSFSFIHLTHGKVEFDETKSGKNMVEVAVIVEIVEKLHKECVLKNQKISVGCITPYKAQVLAIQRKLGNKYGTEEAGKSNFCVNVRTVDGFQGCEEDVIIISTVTSIGNGSIGFLATPRRANVALTRARHCLWILGNGDTLEKSSPIWTRLVVDAKARHCFHVGHDNKSLGQVIINSLVELGEFHDLLDMNSLPFKEATWKVILDDDFIKSIRDIGNPENYKEVHSLLMRLSCGQHAHQVEKVRQESEFIKQTRVNCRGLSLVWSIDILEENIQSVQVLKVWDVLQGSSKLKRLIKRIHMFYQDYDEEKLNRCKAKLYERNFEVPKIWPKVDDDSECISIPIAGLSLTKEAGSSSL